MQTLEDYAAELVKIHCRMTKTMYQDKMNSFSKGEMFVLQYLISRDCVLPIELSRALNASTPRITSILNSLERKQWITRERAPSDRRKVQVSLTETGRAYAIGERECAHQFLIQFLTELGRDDAGELIRISNRAVDIISSMKQNQIYKEE